MTLKEFADMLNAREYGFEITEEEEALARELGYVVVFGASDDLMEFRGAIDDEIDCYGGGTGYITKDGMLKYCEDECVHWKEAKKKAKKITSYWCNDSDDGFTWTYDIDLPCAEFEIFDDEEKYCRGIVFDLKEVDE